MELLVQITAPHFCAGAIFELRDGEWACIEAAPIIRYMTGRSSTWLKSYAARKRWSWQIVPSAPIDPGPITD